MIKKKSKKVTENHDCFIEYSFYNPLLGFATFKGVNIHEVLKRAWQAGYEETDMIYNSRR